MQEPNTLLAHLVALFVGDGRERERERGRQVGFRMEGLSSFPQQHHTHLSLSNGSFHCFFTMRYAVKRGRGF